jgi:hypothetical protein
MKIFVLLFLALLSPPSFAGSGKCDCPEFKSADERSCGERSKFCRRDGLEPACSTATEREKSEKFKKMCPKAYKRFQKKKAAESSLRK